MSAGRPSTIARFKVVPPLAGVAVAITALLLTMPTVSIVGHRLSDWVVRERRAASRPPGPDVVVIAIDDASRRAITEPMAYWQPEVAKLVRALARSKARAIGIDLLFSTSDDRSRSEARQLAQALAEADSSGTPVILGYALNAALPPSPPYLLAATASPRRLGYMDLPGDEDDAVRRFVPCREDPPEVAYSLGTRLALAALQQEGACELDSRRLRTQSLRAEMDGQHSLSVPFERVPEPLRLSFVEALQLAEIDGGKRLDGLLAGKLVLIGSYELQDRHVTPLQSAGERAAGVDIHAAIAQSLYSGQVLRPAPAWIVWSLAFICALMGGAAVFAFRWQLSLFTAVIVILFSVLPMWAARAFGTVLPVMPELSSAVCVVLVAGVYRYRTESRSQRELREQFGKFVSPEVVEQIVRDGLELGGTRRFVTILFADVRGFTTYAERMSPEVLVVQLNEYLDAMTEAIIAEGGYVDKFIGDGILAVFGAPVAQRDSAWHGVLAANRMLERLADLNTRWRKEARAEWSIGIGIHSGDAVVGNIGSWRKLDYTVVGDTVNTASRIESLTKTSIQRYNAHILLSGATVEELERWDHYCDVFAMDIEQLKGKEQLTQLFVLRGLHGAGRKGVKAHV